MEVQAKSKVHFAAIYIKENLSNFKTKKLSAKKENMTFVHISNAWSSSSLGEQQDRLSMPELPHVLCTDDWTNPLLVTV